MLLVCRPLVRTVVMARPSSNVTLLVPQYYIVTGLLGLVRSEPSESGNATAS